VIGDKRPNITAIGRREALRGIGTMSATLAIGGDRDQPRGTMSLSNDVLPTTELRHGAYICVGVPRDRRALVEAPVEVLARRLGFQSEFKARDARRDRSGADIEQDAQAQGRCRHAGHHTAG
jgi:hypothetical protein